MACCFMCVGRLLLQSKNVMAIRRNTSSIFTLFNSKRSSLRSCHLEAIDRVRNIGILAHVDGGKTTLTEQMLFSAGVIGSCGNVDKGNTVTDFLEMERARGITINSAAVTFNWKHSSKPEEEYLINLIDTPGHVDFNIEVERALRVLDGVLVLLDASAGIQAQTSAVWRQADRYRLPRVVVINKLDKPNANFKRCIASLKHKLTDRLLVCHVPLTADNRERTVPGFVDVVSLTKYSINESNILSSSLCTESDFLVKDVVEARENLLTTLADFDDTIADCILSETYDPFKSLNDEVISRAVRKLCLDLNFCPVVCTSALKGWGIQTCLDAVCDFLPSPRNSNVLHVSDESLTAFVFKIFSNPNMMQKSLAYVRVYSGSIQPGDTLTVVGGGAEETVQKRLFETAGDSLKPVREIGPGKLGVLVGVKHVKNGDTLCRKGDKNVQKLSEFAVPKPVVYCQVEAENAKQLPKLAEALRSLCREDPSLHILDSNGMEVSEKDSTSLDLVLGGMGNLHLEVVKHRLLQEYDLDVRLGDLNVQHKESIKAPSTLTEASQVVLQGKQHSVTSSLSVYPLPQEDASRFDPRFENVDVVLRGGSGTKLNLSESYYNAIRSGVRDSLKYGNLGLPVCNVKLVLNSVSISEGCSTAIVQSSIASAVRKVLKQAGSQLLEPYMEVDLLVPFDLISDVIDDVTRRQGQIGDVTEAEGQGSSRLHFTAPLNRLLDYSTEVRLIFSGKVTLESMLLTSYSYKSE